MTSDRLSDRMARLTGTTPPTPAFRLPERRYAAQLNIRGDDAEFRQLRALAAGEGVQVGAVVRSLVRRLLDDPTLRSEILQAAELDS